MKPGYGPPSRSILILLLAAATAAACGEQPFPFDANDPARGPADLIGKRPQLNDSFEGGFAGDVDPREVDAPTDDTITPCDADCRSYCDGLALVNPVDAGACHALWGIGLDTRPVANTEACRRLYVDMLGEFPTRAELRKACDDKDWDEVVSGLLDDPRFAFIQQRYWADTLLYNNEALSFERIYDADDIVEMLYEGRLAYDEFAAVISAHPVLTRRYDTPGDRAEKLFDLFLGRPPYESERADMARLYVLWTNGYFDHPRLGMRLPDAVIGYRCVDEDGDIDDGAKGECTSVLWGYNELILTPDYRAAEGEMWSGLLTADEWHALQAPGRIIAEELGFWEHAADQVLKHYLGYNLGQAMPEVRQSLLEYVLAHDGDIRALHYAVATSQLYLQSSKGATPTEHRYTYGPFKQVEVEPWIDTVKKTTDYALSVCDHRLPVVDMFLDDEASPAGLELIEASRWQLRDGRIDTDYRDLARTLGGCPDNGVGGRFKTVSILTTATQEGFVAQVCNPTLQPEQGADVAMLLPESVGESRAITPDIAESIVKHQVERFFGRRPSDEEIEEARTNADRCAPKPCTAESFARPVCYALLSSSEMLFY